MTIASTPRKAGPFNGNGVQTAFPFTFKTFARGDVRVTVASAAGVLTDLVLDTDFTVTLNSNQDTSPGGSVTYPISGAPLPSSGTLVILSDLDLDQPLDLPAGGNFAPQALENQLDRSVMQIQQVAEEVARSVRMPETSTADTLLPVPQAGKLLAWNSTATGMTNMDAADLATAVAYATAFTDTFTGTGSQTVFTLSADPGTIHNLAVTLDGLTLQPVVDYQWSSGTTLTLTVAPADDALLQVRFTQAVPIENDLLRADLAETGGAALVGYGSSTVAATLDALVAGDSAATSAVLAKITAFMQQELTDYRGDTLPNAFRRIVQYRRPVGGGDVYEAVAEKSINTTAVGYCLRYLGAVAERNPAVADGYIPFINRLAALCLAMQHNDPRKARFGGFALAPKEGTASAYNAGMVGLGLLAAYRVTLNPTYLKAARDAATFLGVLNNPNARYTALYGVTPISATAQNASWNGFCDQISAADTILTSHSTWNLLASKFLKELYDITGTAAYQTLYQNTRDFGAAGVTTFQDFWSVYHSGALPSNVTNNWFATGITVSDGAWHRRGESVSGSTQNTGACAGATTTTITLAAGASSVNDAYNGMAVRMTSGASNAKGSVITDYDGATKVATLRYPFPTTPTAGDTYVVGLAVNTIGSDQMEYGIEGLYATGYNLAAIRTAYETIRGWPNADGGAFGTAYDSRLCWTGYFRPEAQVYGGVSKAFGTQYDVQGIGPLLKFKAEQYPDDYTVSLEKALLIPDVATLVDKDWNTIWSLDTTGLYEYTTVGTGTVKGTVGLGIVEATNA